MNFNTKQILSENQYYIQANHTNQINQWFRQ